MTALDQGVGGSRRSVLAGSRGAEGVGGVNRARQGLRWARQALS